jgi:steroid delta-isomerase-like uncharacterized protein
MASSNVETFKAAHEAFNRRDYDGVVDAMAAEMSYRDHAQNTTFQGKSGFKQFLQGLVAAFSNVQVAEATYIDAGDTVVAQFVNRGTNDGPLGPLPATGKPLELHLCEILRFDAEGHIVSGELYYDRLSIMAQLGHSNPPPEKGATA